MYPATQPLDDDTSDTLPPRPASFLPTPNEPIRVLLVEPAPLIQQLIRRALLALRYDVTCVASLAEVERALRVTRPHLVLAELNLADGSGDGVCWLARARLGAQLPFVLMSAGSEQDLARRATRCRADRTFSKSRGLNALLPLVNQLALDATALPA